MLANCIIQVVRADDIHSMLWHISHNSPNILLSFRLHNYVARHASSKSVAGFAIAERKMEQKKTKDYNYNNTTLFATTGRRKEVESSEVFGGG